MSVYRQAAEILAKMDEKELREQYPLFFELLSLKKEQKTGHSIASKEVVL